MKPPYGFRKRPPFPLAAHPCHSRWVLNVKAYGARGDGVTDDRLAIQAAINDAHEAGGGAVYVPSVDIAQGKYYRLANAPLYLRDNVMVFGDGASSLIHNDKPERDEWMDQGVFQCGNFSPRAFFETVKRDLDPVPMGAKVVKLASIADAVHYPPGAYVLVESYEHWEGSGQPEPETGLFEGWPRPLAAFTTEVESVDTVTGEVLLRHTVPVPIENARIGNIAQRAPGTPTASPDLYGEPYYMVRRATLRSLGIRTAGTWHGHGGMLECLWQDLHIHSINSVYGNAFSHSHVSTVWAQFQNKLVEAAMYSYNSSITNVRGQWRDFGFERWPGGWIKVGENARKCVIDASIDSGSSEAQAVSVVRVTGGAYDNVVHVNADAPKLAQAAVFFTVLPQGPNQAVSERNTITGDFRVGETPRYVRFTDNSESGVTTLSDNVVSVRVTGTLTSVNKTAVQMCGERNDISGSVFGDGQLVLKHVPTEGPEVQAINTRALDVLMPNGVDASDAALLRLNPVRRLVSTRSQALARVNRAHTSGTIEVNSTTSGNVVDQIVIPAGSLSPGDELRVLAHGRIVGTNGQKFARLHIAETSTDIATIDWAAGGVTSFHFDARVYFRTTGFHNSHASQTQGTAVTARNQVGTLNTESSAVTVSLRAWVANAADVVRVDRIEWRTVPSTES